jgi:hypothetical protein
MPYDLDMRTLVYSAGIVSLMLTLCMFYVLYARKTYAGFFQWTISVLLTFLGFMLLSLRGIFPDFLTIVVANSLLVASTLLIIAGIEAFIGLSRKMWQYSVPLVFLIITFVYFTYFSASLSARVAIISVTRALLFTYCAFLIHKYIPPLLNGRNRLLIITFGVVAAWFLIRAVLTIYSGYGKQDLMLLTVINQLSFIFIVGGNIGIITGLIILNSQRIEHELSTVISEIRQLKGILPICASCKKIRDDKGYWNQIESYIRDHSEAEFSHGICPDCAKKLYPGFNKP